MDTRGENSSARRPTMLEMVANLSTIIVSLLLSFVLIRVFLLSEGRPAASAAKPQVAKGTSLKGSLAGVDWSKNGRTLVLAISTRCHFCTDSAPFFQRISREWPAGTKLLAVLPQTVDESRKYLEQVGVRVDDVKQASHDAIKVSGTLTLLLVDKGGTVAGVWFGKLEPSQEEDVYNPCGEMTFALADNQDGLRRLRELPLQPISHAYARFIVHLEDGLRWMMSRYERPDPEHLGQWVGAAPYFPRNGLPGIHVKRPAPGQPPFACSESSKKGGASLP